LSKSSKAGGNQAKFGRGSRSPSSVNYRSAQRWLTNKAKRIKRNARRIAKCALRKIMRLPESSRDYDRIKELRHVISQNLTGAR
jgi:hypothetical protein